MFIGLGFTNISAWLQIFINLELETKPKNLMKKEYLESFEKLKKSIRNDGYDD